MKLEQWTDTLKNGATVTEDFMGAAEAVLISIVGRVACWLTPLPSAVLVSRAAGRVFNLDGWWSIVIAVVLEMVGLVTSNLWLTAKEWNETKRKSDPEANERLALWLMVSYFVTAFLLLLAVELPAVISMGDLTGLTALLFPGLSAVGVIALNERVTHYRRVEAIEAVKREHKAHRAHKRTPQGVHTGDAQDARSGNGRSAQKDAQIAVLDTVNRTRQDRKQQVMSALLEAYKGNPELGASEAARLVGVHRNTVYNYNAELEKAGRLRANGNRWEVV
jgi:hypothetical protein